ncbi:hypothetical protein [Ancylomarina sp. 16SWW S1-10-2]|uniref:hypothetical protein n=1 Tax=Ancylomarina sp. 16SWW S1-10-2 TaxID=2499681 RepID=UPI0012AD5D45|nr:hypothetical protein [Ancylomarina sp. 16SWW S1-10-2]MRT91950.1 hypothetical protein [Ancylomarina sp. 16SWW S1-10-2]
MTKECIELIATWITIIGLPLAVIGIVIGIIQFKFAKRIEEAKFWLDLRDAFKNHDEVNINLRNGGKWTKKDSKLKNNGALEDWALVDAYLGQFELCKTMLDKKLINLNTFREQYDYRIHNIINNESIKNKIKKEKDDWKTFIELCRILGYEV